MKKKPAQNPVEVKTEPPIVFIAMESFAFNCDGVVKEIKFLQEFSSEVPEIVRKNVKHKQKG